MDPVIDCLVNVEFADRKQPAWMTRVKDDYFKAGDSFFASPELPELLDDMDKHGVTRAVLLTRLDAATDSRALRFVEQCPERFALAVGGLDLLHPMPTLRALESFTRDHPVVCANVGPSFWGDGMYPPSDAVYYPLYTKCCELDLPLCTNTGLPGPPLPGEVQNPIHLDRVYETDMAEGLKVMALEGHGVAFLPHSAVKKEVRAHRLVSPTGKDMPALEMTMEVRAYREKPTAKDASKRTVQALWAFLAKGGSA